MTQDPIKAGLLDILRGYRIVLLPWHEEDLCFLHLDVFRCVNKHGTDPQVALVWDIMRTHNQQCGGCLRNVLAESQTTRDPFKANIYRTLHQSALMADMCRCGGRFTSESRDDGYHWILAYPPSIADSPVRQVEGFFSKDAKHENWVIADVLSKALFDDPTPVLEWLDATVIQVAQEYETRSEWQPAGWLHVLAEPPASARVRWEGRVKTIARGWSLRHRYQDLLRKHLDEDVRQESSGDPVLTDSSADAAATLALRDLVLKYDGRVPFHSFAKTTLGFREIDAKRHASVDVFGHVVPDADAPTTDAYGNESPSILEEAIDGLESQGWRDEIRSAADLLSLQQQKERLLPTLAPRERAIIEILSEDAVTDAEVARRLGVARETITRDRAAIEKKARAMFPPKAV